MCSRLVNTTRPIATLFISRMLAKMAWKSSSRAVCSCSMTASCSKPIAISLNAERSKLRSAKVSYGCAG